MLALVMDGGSHMKRPWDNEQTYRGPDARNVMQPMTDLGGGRSNTQPLHKLATPSHMLPPIVTAPEQSARQMQPDRISTSAAASGAPQRHPHTASPQDMLSKRPRLYYDVPHPSDIGRNQPPTHDAHARMRSTSRDRHDQQQWSPWESRNPEGAYTPRESCQNCFESKGLVEKVVAGLERLEAELRQVLACSPLGRTLKEESTEPPGGSNVADAGMKDSLIWASRSVEASTRLVRELASTQRALPRISVANLGIGPGHEPPSTITSAPPDFSRGFMDKHDRDRQKDTHRRYATPYRTDYQMQPADAAQPQSPHPAGSSRSVYGSSQSPMAMSASGRMLPSPSSIHNPLPLSAVQAGYSPTSNQSAHATHLQDLQHQISTKSLALTTLQREHDQLLGAYSRMQIRCQTLDKKSQVSDHEINTLTEEKMRLQSQVEAFEVQVEELVKARDEAQKQTTANGAQYMRIMAMSSKLQVQGAEEAKQYKTDREAWERDREGLQRQIEDLEAKQAGLTISGDAKPDTRPAPNPEDILASASLDVLRNEITRLRRSLQEMERVLLEVRQESASIDHVITECTSIRERLNARTVREPQVQATTTTPPPTATVEDQGTVDPAVAELMEAAQEEESREG